MQKAFNSIFNFWRIFYISV